MSNQRNTVVAAAAVLGLAALLGVLGCGSGPKTYTVRGKLELTGGDVQALAGHTLEAMSESDPTVRASGVIQPDGSFTLETLHAGAVYKGAQEGTYQARIILADDDKEAMRRARAALNARFLQFKTSGLTFKVPPEGEVTLKVAGR